MLVPIHLHGRLGEIVGHRYDLAVVTVGEAVRALSALDQRFRPILRSAEWEVLVRRDDDWLAVTDTDMTWRLDNAELHIYPAGAGHGRGAGKAIFGVLLIAAAFAFAPAVIGAAGPTLGMATPVVTVAGMSITYANIAMFGFTLAISGVAQMLSPQPKPQSGATAADPRDSYMLQGPTNRAVEGAVIPLAYGHCRIGSLVASASLRAEDYAAGAASFPPSKSTYGVIESYP